MMAELVSGTAEAPSPRLRRGDLDADPMGQFERWFLAAQSCGNPEPTAMTLATVDAAGSPDARIVLLKGYDRTGFTFFTNYDSRKGVELTNCPRACLVFFWVELGRQVRVRGAVERTSREESEAYFATRPRGSQLGAWASHQSVEVPDSLWLERRLADVTARLEGQPVPCPPYWGGFRLIPFEVEFWQGQPSRLHDRFRYVRATGHGAGASGARWEIHRLSP
jgi:pyridoxamine 5'-phosphate oxidase